MNDLISKAVVAEVLGVSKRHVNRLVEVGVLPRPTMVAVGPHGRRQVHFPTSAMPAAKLLREGDLLLSIDGHPAESFAVVERAAQAERVSLKALRDGEELQSEPSGEVCEQDPECYSGEGQAEAGGDGESYGAGWGGGGGAYGHGFAAEVADLCVGAV